MNPARPHVLHTLLEDDRVYLFLDGTRLQNLGRLDSEFAVTQTQKTVQATVATLGGELRQVRLENGTAFFNARLGHNLEAQRDYLDAWLEIEGVAMLERLEVGQFWPEDRETLLRVKASLPKAQPYFERNWVGFLGGRVSGSLPCDERGGAMSWGDEGSVLIIAPSGDREYLMVSTHPENSPQVSLSVFRGSEYELRRYLIESGQLEGRDFAKDNLGLSECLELLSTAQDHLEYSESLAWLLGENALLGYRCPLEVNFEEGGEARCRALLNLEAPLEVSA